MATLKLPWISSLKSKSPLQTVVMSWSDELYKTKFLKRMWQGFSLLQIPTLLLVSGHNLWLHHNYNTALAKKEDRIILTPAVRSQVIIDYGSSVPNSFVLESARRVVNLQENWHYTDIEENYDELFNVHASFEFSKFLKANLVQTGFIDKVKMHRMVSRFRWDKDYSKAAWSSKIKAVCALITGTRTVFKDGNIPISTTKVGYLIISNVIYPTDERPTALQIDRMIIEDRNDPYTKLEPLFHAAQNGTLPDGVINAN